MPPHHLVVNCSSNVIDCELTTLLRDLCIKNYLKQQVTKLVAKLERPALASVFNGLKRFVRLFEKHRSKRCVSLFAVPRTAIWRTQPIHQGYQIIECGRHAGSLKCPAEN